MKAIVAGGRGFVGRHVCAWLERAGHEVRVVGRGDPLERGDVIIHLGLFDEATARDAVAVQGCPLIVASSGDVYYVYDQLRGREPWDGQQPGALSEASPLRAHLFPYGHITVTPKGTFVDDDKILVERVVLAEPRRPSCGFRRSMARAIHRRSSAPRFVGGAAMNRSSSASESRDGGGRTVTSKTSHTRSAWRRRILCNLPPRAQRLPRV